MTDNPHLLRRVLLGLFAVSGFAGLIYESIWSHYLKLMLGHAAYAQTLVLAIFMGGMALGAWLTSRASERWRNPLAVYAVIEALIGLFALLFHSVFVRSLAALYDSLLPAIEQPALAALVKWGLATGLILPQSILLGMTFPLMCAAVLRLVPAKRGASLSLLYFTNSIGACVGVLASGFVLIPWAGLPGTILIAGLLNIALAIVLWGLAAPTVACSRPAEVGPSAAGAAGALPGLLLAAMLTGAASFAYEIGWIRMLSLVLGTTSQAFELMLSAFILGLALGGLWIRRRVDRLESPLRFAGYVQLLMGVLALMTLPLYSAAFDAMGFMIEHLDKTDSGYALFHIGSQIIAMGVMLPATVMAGMTLPLFTFALLRRGGGERAIGRVYAANTVGAILGVLAAVHVVMPAVGTHGLIVSGAAIDVALGFAFLCAVRRQLPRWEPVTAMAVAVAVLVAVSLGGRTDLLKTASGVYREGVSRLPEDSEVVFHRDGKTATIDLIRYRDGALQIATNGKPDARIAVNSEIASHDEITMVMMAGLALSLHPDARTVANIGMGSGLTTNALLGVSTLERVDTVEIEESIVEAARAFGRFSERVYSDPRSRVHVEDAKSFFSNTRQRYDLILSEPSNPWVSGVGSLFSEEFYHHIRQQLNREGILIQWLQLYETNVDLMSSIFKALSTEFDDYSVFNTDNANVLVVATNGGNLRYLDPWVFEHAPLSHDMRRVGLARVQDLELRRIGSRALLQPTFAALSAPSNSDYFPYVSLHAPRSRYLGESAVDLTRLHVAPIPVAEMLDPYVQRNDQPHTTGSYFAPAQSRDTAARLVQALSTDALTATHGDVAPAIREGLESGACAGPVEDEQLLMQRLGWLAGATNPYLPGKSLDLMWDRLGQRLCSDRLSPEIRDWFLLHRAVGRRDAPAMLQISRRLIATAGLRSNLSELDYLLAAGLTGALASGDAEGARHVAATFASIYPAGTEPPFYLRLLLLQR